VDLAEARGRAERALGSGRALDRFRRLVVEQGGDPGTLERPERLHTAPERVEVRAERAGTVHRVRARLLGEAIVALGGGRVRVEDRIDPGVGFEVLVRPGDTVSRGDPIGRVHARDAAGVALGSSALRDAVVIEEGRGPEPLPLVLERVTAG
jgi:thymidine phosphorylase